MGLPELTKATKRLSHSCQPRPSPAAGAAIQRSRRAAGVAPDDVLEHMRGDKKADSKGLKLILVRALGEATLAPAPADATLN